MPKKAFVYNSGHSQVALLPANNVKTKLVPKAMAQVKFNAVYFEFEGEQQKPYLVFEGDVEAYTILKDSKEDFFSGIKRVAYAPENRPSAFFRYDFNEKQIAEIAEAGWFERGSDTPPEFLSTSFALIVDNIQVDMLNPGRRKGEAPILKVGPAENRMYSFDIKDYDLTPFITDNVRLKQTEFETVAQTARDEHKMTATEAMKAREAQAIRTPETLSAQQMRIRNAAKNVMLQVDAYWADIDAYRAEHNAVYKRDLESRKARQAQAVQSPIKANTAGNSGFISSADNDKLNGFLGQFKSASGASALGNTGKPAENTGSAGIAIRTRADNNVNKATNTDSTGDTAVKRENAESAGNADKTDRKAAWIASMMSGASSASGSDAKAIKARNDNAVAVNRKDDAAQAAQSEITENEKNETNKNAVSDNTDSVGKTDSESVKKRNEKAVADNRADDAAQAVQSDIAENADNVQSDKPDTISEKNKVDGDARGTGIDDRVEQGRAALQAETDTNRYVQDELKLRQSETERNKLKNDGQLGS